MLIHYVNTNPGGLHGIRKTLEECDLLRVKVGTLWLLQDTASLSGSSLESRVLGATGVLGVWKQGC